MKILSLLSLSFLIVTIYYCYLNSSKNAEKVFVETQVTLIKNIQVENSSNEILEKSNAVLKLKDKNLKYSFFSLYRKNNDVKKDFSEKEKSAFLMSLLRLKICDTNAIGISIVENKNTKIINIREPFGDLFIVEDEENILFLICFTSDSVQFINPKDDSIFNKKFLKNHLDDEKIGLIEKLQIFLSSQKKFKLNFQDLFTTKTRSFYSPEMGKFIESLKEQEWQTN